MHFRPALGPTIATAIMLPVLIGLGVWQVQRLHWKEGLLAAIDHSIHAAPVSVDQLPKGPRAPYIRVTARGTFDHTKEAYLFGSDTAGTPGYHVITPLRTANGATFLIDRGYVPTTKRDPQTRAEGQVPGTQTITGLLRTEEQPGLFTPAADTAHHVWYVRDADAIAKAEGLTLAEPGIIDADATPNPGGWPKGGQTIIDIPNNHLSYAFTWFGLALVLLGVYVAYHMGQGRLRFRPPPSPSAHS
ncbi:MAG TPA: SURF1 family protein [Rhizomicrobium sp.]|jgi:surfeit locus 1 family protein|nr:SURF1 family protein [Rhizomicrobium sp.]